MITVYYESAKGATMSRDRAIREVSECGEDQDAQKVLDWLGY